MGLAALLAGQGVDVSSVRHIAVTADMANATWNTQTTHEVFDVTGRVRARILILCAVNIAGAGSIQFGYAGVTNAFVASTAGTDLDVGDIWIDATPTETNGAFATMVTDRVVPNGLDIGYEITVAALTGGSLVFHCWWEPLDALGNVVAGAGGVL